MRPRSSGLVEAQTRGQKDVFPSVLAVTSRFQLMPDFMLPAPLSGRVRGQPGPRHRDRNPLLTL